MNWIRLGKVVWGCVPDLISEWTEKCAAPAWDIRQATSMVFTQGDVGYYWHPEREQVGYFCRRSTTPQDLALVKAALDKAGVGKNVAHALTLADLVKEPWIKVAYSPTLRRTGEALNFFPGHYPGGIPNSPSPLAATLTGGLVGAGLGYGGGMLAEKLLPKDWKRKRLRRTMALLGGAVGALPGAAWSYSAANRGRSLLDGSDLAGGPSDRPSLLESPYKEAAELLEPIPLGQQYAKATERYVKRAYDTFSKGLPAMDQGPLAVDVNRLGQVLWDVGADPRTAATTMGSLYAAQQLPDPNARPGFVTPHQTGLLGTMMGAAGGGVKGYAAGYLVGKSLGLLTGMPPGPQNTVKRTGMAIGIINATVPRLFGSN